LNVVRLAPCTLRLRLADWSRSGLAALLRLHLGDIGRREVDRVEQQRSEATAGHRLADHLASEWEQQARGLDQKDRAESVLGKVAGAEQAGVGEVHDEVDPVVGTGRDVDLDSDFVDFVGDFLRIEAELYVERRLRFPLIDRRSIRILDREILDILGEDAELCARFGARRR